MKKYDEIVNDDSKAVQVILLGIMLLTMTEATLAITQIRFLRSDFWKTAFIILAAVCIIVGMVTLLNLLKKIKVLPIKKLSKQQVEERLDEICRTLAEQKNDGSEYFETNANGFYVNTREKKVEFEFTMMNDKYWEDFSFEQVKTLYGLDIKRYQGYFENE